MNTSKQHTFLSTLSVNPYKGTCFSGVSGFLTRTLSPEFSKDQFVISCLNTKDFISSFIEISKNIPDEDLYDAISSKAYDELALDQAVEYQIQYIESFRNLNEENRYFHIFIVDPIQLKDIYHNIVAKVKYIDVLIPTPLLIKSLYTQEIIENNGVHCFVYFQESDACITLYSDKEFLYTKSIKYSLMDMHERFCELYGERVEYASFLNFFTKESLRDTKSDYKEFFIKLYKELFAHINDILTYAKRAFEIDKFEHLYVGSRVETFTQLDEMLEVELNVKSSAFNFNFNLETQNNEYVDQVHSLMQVYATLKKSEKYQCNFTIYKRPPAFIKRESGKLILLTAASFALAFAYPISYWIATYALMLQEDLLTHEYNKLHTIKITREATIKTKMADKDKAIALLTQEKKEYSDKKHTLIKIHEVKVDYPMKAKLIAMLTKDLNKFALKVEKINYAQSDKSKYFTLNLISTQDRKVTRLIEYLTKTYEHKFQFKLENISYDEKLKQYFSELKVSIL